MAALSRSALNEYLRASRAPDEIAPSARNAPVPLSFGQEQIWLHGLMAPDLPLYNETIALHYRGALDSAIFAKSLAEMAERHDILRTSIQVLPGRLSEGEPCQFVRPGQTVTCSHAALSLLAPELREEEAWRLASISARQPFDLARGALLRALVVKLSPDEYRVFLTLHHLVFDGASIRRIFLPELTGLYDAHSRGTLSCLAPPGLQFADFATWERRRNGETGSLAYWQAQLAGLPALRLPTDRARTAQTGFRGAAHRFRFDPALVAALRGIGLRESSTLFHLMLASFSVLLARHSGETDLPLGTMSAGRTRSELEGILGYFLNTIVLRVDLSGEPTFLDLLARVRETTLSALSHADAPFQHVVRALGRNGHNGHDGPVPVMFTLQPPMAALPPEWALDTFEVSSGTAKFELHIELEETGDELLGRVLYNTDLFDASTVASLVERWSTLLRGIVAQPESSIWALPLLSEQEVRWHTGTLNQTGSEYPQLALPCLFTRQAARTPDRIAVGCGEQTLNYEELDARSTRLANHLRRTGAGAVIAVLLDRSPELVVALLGILKAGAAYVPLDPTYPVARLESMLRNSGASFLVTHSSLYSRLPAAHPPRLELDRQPVDRDAPEAQLEALPAPSLAATAYILFTSGSTGEPKGVEIPHRGLTNLLWSMKREPGIEPDDVLLAITGISFDIAALELFLPLMAGARVELATAREAADPVLLQAKLVRSRATVMQATPTTWRMLIESGWEGAKSLKALCGGEAMTQTLAARLLPRVGALWNMYGPTETTIWSACCRIERAEAPVALGTPIANTSLYVLDDRQRLVPAGCPGELYIGGDGVAIGYTNNPQETAAKFLFLPLGTGSSRRVYRTGDRVLRHPDGSLVFLGRADQQVKLHGFRVELGEIEQAIRSFPGVGECVVLHMQPNQLEAALAAYVAPRAHAALGARELRRHLAQLLPAPLRPSTISVLDRFPLTPNGKLDRNRLPAPAAGHPEEEELPRAGTEQSLAAIWSELLQVERVDREDDFFDLGGHSLLAARLMTRISKVFQQRLSLATLVQAPTVAQLATLLDTQLEKGSLPPLAAPLRRGVSAHKHLLWIGSAPWLRALAALLAPDQGLSTLAFDSESFRSFAPGYRLEDMARQMSAQVRQLQPKGPYVLGGFCLEAVLAYEVAQQLQAEGEQIALLVLGDVPAPGHARKSWRWHWERRLRQELPLLGRLRRCAPAKMGPLLRWRWEAFREAGERRRWQRFGRTGVEPPEPPETMLQALYMAEPRYKVKPFGGRVCLLEAEGGRDAPPWNTASTWKSLVEKSETFIYTGEHLDFFQEPGLSRGAAYLRDAIDRAVRDAGSDGPGKHMPRHERGGLPEDSGLLSWQSAARK